MDVLGWLAAVTLGRSPKARPWVGRAFIAIAVLGLLVGAWHIASGWAEKHPLAGHPTVSRDTVMVYALRDAAELEVVTTLVTASWRYARGN